MSLSTCEICGGHIPLGPNASNKCEKCGAHVFAGLPRSTTNDNARIIREALIECGKQLNCSMADDLLALGCLESELNSAKRTAKIQAEHAGEVEKENLHLETELATAKADLERAREEERERIIAVLWKGPFLIKMRTPEAMGDDCPDWDDYEDLDTEEKFNRLRAALAPEQKG